MRFTRALRRAHIWRLEEPINTTERNNQRIGAATDPEPVITKDRCWSDKGRERLLLSPQHNSRVGIAELRHGALERLRAASFFLLLWWGKPLT